MRQLWNVWGPRPVNIHHDYLIHAMEETETGGMPERTVCGTKIGKHWQTGLMKIPSEVVPGCFKCREKIRRVKTPQDESTPPASQRAEAFLKTIGKWVE